MQIYLDINLNELNQTAMLEQQSLQKYLICFFAYPKINPLNMNSSKNGATNAIDMLN